MKNAAKLSFSQKVFERLNDVCINISRRMFFMNVSFSIFHGCSQYYWPVLVPDLDHIHTCTNARTASRVDRETDREPKWH